MAHDSTFVRTAGLPLKPDLQLFRGTNAFYVTLKLRISAKSDVGFYSNLYTPATKTITNGIFQWQVGGLHGSILSKTTLRA